MKVADLSSEELDYWVMRALSSDPARVIRGRPRPYSSEWGDGGPIIERERIDVAAPNHVAAAGQQRGWSAAFWRDGFYLYQQFGPTALIAAMRAYVASKFGNEVPEEK